MENINYNSNARFHLQRTIDLDFMVSCFLTVRPDGLVCILVTRCHALFLMHFAISFINKTKTL